MENSDYIRGFYRHSHAWYYRNDSRVQVSFGIYHVQGGTKGEMNMEWGTISSFSHVPRLQCYGDAFKSLAGFPDVIVALAEKDNENITEPEFSELLIGCGFKDLTPYKRPQEVALISISGVEITFENGDKVNLQYIPSLAIPAHDSKWYAESIAGIHREYGGNCKVTIKE